MVTKLNFTEQIKKAIEQTALNRKDESIVTAEDMIPKMDHAKYQNKILDIPYGGRTQKEKLDIYYPETGDGPFPVFVEVHGGGWYFGQKNSVEFEPFLAGLERGFACVSLGYTLSPEEHYPVPVQEIKAAIRFLRKNAEKYKLDPDRLALWGGSAGAHLAGLAAASCDTGYLAEDLFGNDAYSAKPNALILWYGCFGYNNSGKMEKDWVYQNFFGCEDLASIEEELRLSNPVEHLTEKACPTFLQHGREDTVVPYRQSVVYYEKLVEKAGEKRNRLELLDQCDHADEKLFAQDNIAKVFDFVENVFSSTK